MNEIKLAKISSLRGEISPPADKSISHRAIILASLAEGKSAVRNFLRAADPLSTVNAFRRLGIEIEEGKADRELIIQGKGLYGFKEPFDVIHCGNSGTTMRLLAGLLAGNPFFSVLTGDDSLKQRPMRRIITPLQKMGALISARADDRYPPVAIRGGNLKAIEYEMPLASAQLKSCLMLAGLYAEGATALAEPFKSRDHTERMLAAMGAPVEVKDLSVIVKGSERDTKLHPLDMQIPADFSSAAFFISAALIVPNSRILMKSVGVNLTRTGLLEVIRAMGGDVAIENERIISGEPVADISCMTAPNLKATRIGKELIPSLIDEFPVLCVLATQAEGVTEIRGADDLRVKESDRIAAMASEMRKFGVLLEEYPDGIAIQGKSLLKGCVVESFGDHRIAMALSVLALMAEGITTIRNASCVGISFPKFFDQLSRLYA